MIIQPKIVHYTCVKVLDIFTVFKFDDLTEDAKQVARLSVIQCEIDSLNDSISNYKMLPLNIRINLNSIPYFIRKNMVVKGFINNPLSYDKVIVSNVCNFLSDGTYIVYSLEKYKNETINN